MSFLNSGYQQDFGNNIHDFGLHPALFDLVHVIKDLVRACDRIAATAEKYHLAMEEFRMSQAKGTQLNLRQIDDNDNYDNPTFRGGPIRASSDGHQAPGSKEVELPKDDGYAAKLPKR